MIRHLLIFFGVCLPIGLTAQSSFDQLFLSRGDTLTGKVINFTFKEPVQQVKFEQGETLTSYSLSEIAGLRLSDGRYFSTQIRANELMEVLLVGVIDLYRNTEFFYLKKDSNSIVKLYEFTEKVKIDSRLRVRTRQFWKGSVIQAIFDCIEQPADFVRMHSLSEKSLVKILQAYHECKAAPYTEYGLNLPWTQISYGPTLGLVNSQLRANALTEPYAFAVDRYQHWGIQAGLVVELGAPRLIQRWSIQTGLLYAFQHFYSDFEEQLDFITQFREFNLSQHLLSIPIAVQHQILLGEINLDIYVGLQFDIYLATHSQTIRERVFSDKVDIFITEDPIDFKSAYYGYLMGFNASKEIAGTRYGLGLRYTSWPRLSNESSLELRGNRFSLNAIMYL